MNPARKQVQQIDFPLGREQIARRPGTVDHLEVLPGRPRVLPAGAPGAICLIVPD
jgi:hypothetical protein